MPTIKVIGKPRKIRQSWMVTIFLDKLNKLIDHPDIKVNDKSFLIKMRGNIVEYKEYSKRQEEVYNDIKERCNNDSNGRKTKGV